MSIFEVQVMSGGRWMANDVFDDLDAAYEYAERIERIRRPEQLRIRRIDHIRAGYTRERTLYDGGRNARSEQPPERKLDEPEAYRQRIVERRIRQNAEKIAGRRKPLFSSNSPVYLTLVSLTIGLTGLSAMYLVERAFS